MIDLVRKEFEEHIDREIVKSMYKLKHKSFRFIAHDRKKDKYFVVTSMEFCKVRGTLTSVRGYDPNDLDVDGYTYHGGSCCVYKGRPRYVVIDTILNSIVF